MPVLRQWSVGDGVRRRQRQRPVPEQLTRQRLWLRRRRVRAVGLMTVPLESIIRPAPPSPCGHCQCGCHGEDPK
jgi:hypothetical protein